MCVLPMQPDNEGVRQMRGCGGLDGGGIAADYNGQTFHVLGEFWPDAEERQCAADLSARIGLGWFGGLEIPCGPTRRRGRLDTNPA